MYMKQVCVVQVVHTFKESVVNAYLEGNGNI